MSDTLERLRERLENPPAFHSETGKHFGWDITAHEIGLLLDIAEAAQAVTVSEEAKLEWSDELDVLVSALAALDSTGDVRSE